MAFHDSPDLMRDPLFMVGQQALDSQPFNQLLGAQLVQFSSGLAVLELTVRQELLQQNGFVHGGVISYLVDNALTFAGGSVLGPDVVTAEFKLNYLRPALGERLRAQAQPVYQGKRQAVCRCDVFALGSDEPLLCTTALGTIMTRSTQGQVSLSPERDYQSPP